MHWDMAAGARRSVGTAYPERAVFVAQGRVEVAGASVAAGQMAVLAPGRAVDVAAVEPSIVMVLGGDPVGERFLFWNFVSSSKARLEQAKEDWRQPRMTLPAGDAQDFAPLPDAPPSARVRD
jgi:redox-sensitive bicupin YhaK (pirin superfamily)